MYLEVHTVVQSGRLLPPLANPVATSQRADIELQEYSDSQMGGEIAQLPVSINRQHACREDLQGLCLDPSLRAYPMSNPSPLAEYLASYRCPRPPRHLRCPHPPTRLESLPASHRFWASPVQMGIGPSRCRRLLYFSPEECRAARSSEG